MPTAPLQFAIVDIETNGGAPNGANITEIAAILHDGTREIDRWVSLINPEAPIPSGITRLTGIDDDMVADAPDFASRAADLYEFLGDAVFVAHNVGFDLRYLQAAFKRQGLHYNPRRLCTVRMSRKWLDGPQRYSLGALCAFLGIDNEAHHRAWGDAAATALLFSRLWSGYAREIEEEISRGDGRSWWPPHLPADALTGLPDAPGVYRFFDEAGNLAYVGMSRSLAGRVRQHFTNTTDPGRAQLLRRTVHQINWIATGSELMALILEDVLIRRHHPPLNAAQKVIGRGWSLEQFTCRAGIHRLSLVKGGKPTALRRFRSRSEGEQWLREAVERHGLNPAWTGLPGTAWAEGWVDNPASRALHNARFAQCTLQLKAARDTQFEQTVVNLPETPEGSRPQILMEFGRFKAYRFIGPAASETETAGETPWEYDAGSGRIDAALERHFLGGTA